KEKLIERLGSFQPHLVGLSGMFTMSHSAIKLVSAAIKEHDPELTVFGGGVHLSNARKLAMEDCPHLDFIGVYECDKSFPDTLDFVNGYLGEEVLAQIGTMIGGDYVAIEERATPGPAEIDAAPLYHDLPVELYDARGQIGSYVYMRQGRRAACVLSNRGCRAHCSFCSVASFNGPGVRERSVKSVVDEIQELSEKYGIRHITWLDDDLLFDGKRAMALFNEITERKMDITWDASNGLISAAITPAIMQAMSESGCIGFNLGIESGNEKMLRAMHKPGTLATFRKSKTFIDEYPHIFVKGFLILGFPNETVRMISDTVNFALELCYDWYPLQALNPLPSTEIYYAMVEQGLIEESLQTKDVAFLIGPHGRQYLRESSEKTRSRDFVDLFKVADPDSVPDAKDIGDYWFLVDYKINYEKIIGIADPVKLAKIAKMLEDICRRVAPENPLGHTFYGLCLKKLGDNEAPLRLMQATEEILCESAYWRSRYEVLGVYDILRQLKD
ncbi:MAG: radical SAM protein, partial [Patescibacteria group bacterium]